MTRRGDCSCGGRLHDLTVEKVELAPLFGLRGTLEGGVPALRCDQTADLFHGKQTARTRRVPPDVIRVALRKLDMLNAAAKLDDLKVPPGLRLEALKGDLQGFHGIRVNDQWRIIFRWAERVQEVRFTAYHS